MIAIHYSLMSSEVAQWYPTFCDPMDGSLPSSSVHGIFQARILEWVAISFARRSSQPRGWTQVSHIVGRHFTIWATREVNDRECVKPTHRGIKHKPTHTLMNSSWVKPCSQSRNYKLLRNKRWESFGHEVMSVFSFLPNPFLGHLPDLI